MEDNKPEIESCHRCQRGVEGKPTGDAEHIYWKFNCPGCKVIWTRNAPHNQYMNLIKDIVEEKKAD